MPVFDFSFYLYLLFSFLSFSLKCMYVCGGGWWFSHSALSYCCDPIRLLCAWDFPGKNSGVGCHFLLQGIFLTQGSNPCLLHCRQSPVSQMDFLQYWDTREAPCMCVSSVSSVQSLSRVRLFATPWTAARQASLSITNSRSSLKLVSIESVMPYWLIIILTAILPVKGGESDQKN